MKHANTIAGIHARCLLLLWGLTVTMGTGQTAAVNPVASTGTNVVTYEALGAVGDGVTDDLPAICKAHAYANQHGLRIVSHPDATCHLGRRALTAIIATDTDWGTSRFIIDDSQGVENHRQPLFKVRALLEPETIVELDRFIRWRATGSRGEIHVPNVNNSDPIGFP